MHHEAERSTYTSLGRMAGSLMELPVSGAAGQNRGHFNPEFERLWIEHHRRLSRMVEWRLIPPLAARVGHEEILQRAAIRAAKNFEALATSRMSPFSWLYRIVRDELIEVWRENLMERRDLNREVRAPSGSAEQASMGLVQRMTSPSENVNRQEMQEAIRQALEKLPDDDREILCMRFFDDMPPAEIAAVKCCTPNAVSTAITRAKAKLKPLLAKLK
jgi:RNA polymerase sigma-70 factor (ECF subfamily)